MTYDGIEIFMMCIGNADCFLIIRHHPNGAQETVLVDGGNKSNAEDIAKSLADLGATHINHVVNTHPHDDHAGGLVELISNQAFTYDQLWMHRSWEHIDVPAIHIQLGSSSAKWVVERFDRSLSTQMSLHDASLAHGVVPVEPFEGSQIGPLTVLGPTPLFYEECLKRFGDTEEVKQWNDYLSAQAEAGEFDKFFDEATQDDDPLGGVTSPENESSVVMTLNFEGKTFLFCGDAGCAALGPLNSPLHAPVLQNVHWLQAPHHGSRRNITTELAAYFNPSLVYVSCAGTIKHPSKKLVNTFKNDCGSSVYSSHYPKTSSRTWICQTYGTVPARNTIPATALYDAE